MDAESVVLLAAATDMAHAARFRHGFPERAHSAHESSRLKVAAYQSPLETSGTAETLVLIRERVDQCERIGVEILCCPEAVLGGLADYADHAADIAIDVDGGQLHETLAALASDVVTTILGFTEIDRRSNRLYNSAAILHRGSIVGVYRKLHPAINRSVYSPGTEAPVFTVGALTFGILICRDSTFSEPARSMAGCGATTLFVPTNNGMPASRGGSELVGEARRTDIARAIESSVAVIRADVAGRASGLVSYGSSGIVDRDGTLLGSARSLQPDLVVAEIGC
jgi:5-aminopentanamidase